MLPALLLGGQLTLQSFAAPRVALIASEQSEAANSILALVEAELSRVEGIVLIERSRIDLVLAEQRLLLSGLSPDDGFGPRAGELIPADLLVRLEMDAGATNLVGLVAVDAQTGVRLWESGLPENLEEAVAQATDGVRIAADKRARPTSGAPAVCVFSVRNEDLPRGQDSAADGVIRLVERKLTGSSRMTVLERRRLDALNEEAYLTGRRPELLVAAALADVSFRRGQTAELEAVVRLTDIDGQVMRETTLAGRELDAALAGNMAEWICDALSGGCLAPRADSKREAEYFAREAVFWYGHRRPEEARRAAEAAFALNPDDIRLRALLVAALIDYAQFVASTANPAAGDSESGFGFPFLLRALALQREVFRHAMDLGPEESRPALRTPMGLFEVRIKDYPRVALWIFRDNPHFIAGWSEIQRQVQALLRDANALRLAGVRNALTLQRYRDWLNSMVLSEWEWWCRSPEEWTDAMLELIPPVLDLMEHYPLQSASRGYPNWLFLRLSVLKFPYESREGLLRKWKFRAQDYERLIPLYERMRAHPEPLVALYGWRGILFCRFHWGIGAERAEDDFDEALETVAAMVRAAREGGTPKALRGLLYQAALDLIDVHPDLAERRRAQLDLFDRMTEQREYEHQVVLTATAENPGTLMYYVPYYKNFRATKQDPGAPIPAAVRLSNLSRALALLDDPECEILHGVRELWRSEIAREKAVLDPEQRGITAPWRSVRLIRQTADERSVSRALPRNGRLVFAEGGTSGGKLFIHLLEADADRGVVATNASLVAARPFNPILPDRPLRAVAMDERAFYVGTMKHGIARLPFDGSPPRLYGIPDGLPSETVQALALEGGKLYAGLGRAGHEAYVVAFDPDKLESKVLASSQRRPPQNAFDGLSPVPHFGSMISDSTGDFVYFTIHSGTTVAEQPFNGLWRLHTRDECVEHVLPMLVNALQLWTSTNGRLEVAGFSSVSCFDPGSGATHLIINQSKSRSTVKGVRAASAQFHQRAQAKAPFVRVGHWIWAATPFTRFNEADGSVELLHMTDSRLNRGHYYWTGFDYWPERHAIIASMSDAIWLIDLREDERPDAAP